MNDLTSLLFYVIIGIVWFLTSILGDRVGRKREWEFPEPQGGDDDVSEPERPPVERIPAKWRRLPSPAKPSPPPATVQARRSAAEALSAVTEKLRTAPPTPPAPRVKEPAPLLEEPAPLFADVEDVEQAVIVSTVLGPPVALQPRNRRFRRTGAT